MSGYYDDPPRPASRTGRGPRWFALSLLVAVVMAVSGGAAAAAHRHPVPVPRPQVHVQPVPTAMPWLPAKVR